MERSRSAISAPGRMGCGTVSRVVVTAVSSVGCIQRATAGPLPRPPKVPPPDAAPAHLARAFGSRPTPRKHPTGSRCPGPPRRTSM
jgi:hypothetical protein